MKLAVLSCLPVPPRLGTGLHSVVVGRKQPLRLDTASVQIVVLCNLGALCASEPSSVT